MSEDFACGLPDYRFGPMFAAEVRGKRIEAMRAHRRWQWHSEEIPAKIDGEDH